MNKYKIAVVIALLVIVLDQVSKWMIRSSLPLYKRIEILPFFDITHLRNTGAAFGILRDLPDSLRFALFTVVLIIAIVVIFIFLKKTANEDKLLIVSLSLILGGAIANSIDRFRLGYVTDFLGFHWFGNLNYQWPPFNVADSAITIGVILIIFDSFFSKRGK
ncbi:signal peptidase II [Desulfobacterota bacterium AH_259_B03_O07]|nr:signal peptidase II [Desulfobacterota bacterium AH_259_B03_O07]